MRPSGDCWRTGDENSEQFYERAQANRAAYEPVALDAQLPPLPGIYAGVRKLAVSADVMLVADNDTLYRAVSFEEAALVRDAEAKGLPKPHLFARPVALGRSAKDWARIFVEQVEHGSFKQTDAVSFTAGSSAIAARLAETAVPGGQPSRMVIAIDAKDITDGVLVRVGGSRLLKLEAAKRSISSANALSEVLLLTPGGTDAYTVVIDKGVVTGFIGEVSGETAWNGVIGKGDVVCTTGVGVALSAAQLAAIKLLGARVSKTPTKKMTLLVMAPAGVKGSKKFKDATDRGVAKIFMATLNKALGLKTAASASASTVVSEGEEASTAAPKATKRARKA